MVGRALFRDRDLKKSLRPNTRPWIGPKCARPRRTRAALDEPTAFFARDRPADSEIRAESFSHALTAPDVLASSASLTGRHFTIPLASSNEPEGLNQQS